MDDRLDVQPLGREQRESLRQVEAHLVAEHAVGARPRPVLLENAGFADMPHQVEILPHAETLAELGPAVKREPNVRRATPLLRRRKSLYSGCRATDYGATGLRGIRDR